MTADPLKPSEIATRASGYSINAYEANEVNLGDYISGLHETLSFVAKKAGAGLCQMSAERKHEFLREISERLEDAGWDVLGDQTGDRP